MTSFRDYNPRAVGMAWFREEDYPALVSVLEDGHKYDSFKQWLQRAEELEAKFKSEGYIVERVHIDPETFPDWCRKNGVGINREGRTKFAAEVVAEKYGRNHS